jgi:hypothetical protein
MRVVIGVGALVIALWIGFSIVAVFGGPAWLEPGSCDDRPFSCGIIGGLVVSALPLGVAYGWLVGWRVNRVRDRYVKHARETPAELVEGTATIGNVVGRDDLCDLILRDLQNRNGRRPHVLVGGVGAGKTAVLVRLTEVLARAGAVPVPIRLRESADGISFHDQAFEAFRRFTDLSAGRADEVWDALFARDVIVVIADGLEEAMAGVRTRDTAIRAAIAEARKSGLPLVVASRPHAALNDIDAAILRLEPLAEAAACHYIEAGGMERGSGEDGIERIVEHAEIVEAPLYMQMARDLQRLGRLPRVDAGGASRLVLRKQLVEEWTAQLIAGNINAGAPLTSEERARVVDTLGRFACLGLRNDSLEVEFDEAFERGTGWDDIKFAATGGAQLDLVHALPTAVRFRHSIMQAYLGARTIAPMITDPKFIDPSLADPGREVLMALAMACIGGDRGEAARRVRPRLLAAARDRRDVKAIELLGTVVEVDVALRGGIANATASAIRAGWHHVTMQDEAALEAKLRVVARIGEGTARRSRFRPGLVSTVGDTCDALWHICTNDDSYRVRHHAAQELGAGGPAAFDRLAGEMHQALDQAEAVYRGTGAEPGDDALRRFSLSGWLLPLFIGSVDDPRAVADACTLLSRWLELVGPDMHVGVEASFAQGFKYAANRRRRSRTKSRDLLIEHAGAMLDRATFWYARSSLFQALTLWELSEEGASRKDAEARVRSWTRDDEHAFAEQTAQLCMSALAQARPSRYVWIDETGVAAKVGPRAKHQDSARTRRLWISPAVGWLALHPRARQLVGDVIILLNLAERGLPGAGGRDARASREERLRRTLDVLPPCLSRPGGRAHLKAIDEDPGTRAAGHACREDCDVRLCPLPRRGQPLFRGELRETFCRNQARLAAARVWGPAPWQHQSRKELHEFWSDMERRAQRA